MSFTLYLLLFIIGFIALKYLTRPLRDKSKWHQWENFLISKNEHPEAYYVDIISIRQKAGTGTKAYVQFIPSGQKHAVWFWELWPSLGSAMIFTASHGNGNHHNEDVLYVNKGDLCLWLPRGYESAWKRHNARMNGKKPI